MKAVAVVDLQFGSTGKGLIAALLGLSGFRNMTFDAAVTNWGPNAGHTAVYNDGEKVVRTMLANSVHRGTVQKVFIGPGSVIDIEALHREAEFTRATGKGFFVFVHENAAVVTPDMRASESVHNRIGSTQKGAGAAAMAKMMRDPNSKCLAQHFKEVIDVSGLINVVCHQDYLIELRRCRNVLIEGCQGYSLGYSSGFWPYVTSRECTTAQLLADTLIAPFELERVVGVMRTYPIRVANRLNTEGEMVGWSGPPYPDQREIKFEDIGQPVEFTTVTKLPRRIFTLSADQVAQAIVTNGVTDLFMNFVNYWPKDEQHERASKFMDELDIWLAGYGGNYVPIRWMGLGPKTSDVHTYASFENMRGGSNV